MSVPSPRPIDDLNDDVLLYIFIHLVDKSYPSFKDALSISQVCSRWRTIATENCPDIWKAHALRVPKSSKERAAMLKNAKMSNFNQEMVRRSHNLPLQFGWDEIMPGTAGVIAMLKFHNQIGSLSLACPTNWPRDGVDQNTVSVAMRRSRMPRLKHLELSSFPPLSLPTPLFRGDLSSLTSLILQPGNLLNLKDLKIGENLRVLRLSGFKARSPEAVTEAFTLFADHVDFLKHTPLLTTLELELDLATLAWGRTPGARISNQVAVVTLPHLTSIELCISFTDFELFLDRVRAPACRKIRLGIATDDIDAKDRIHARIAQLVTAYGSGAPPEGYRLHIASAFICILSPGGTPDMGETLLGTSYKIYLQLYGAHLESPLQPWLTVAERITSFSTLITLDDAEKEMIKKLTALELLICPEKSVHEIIGQVELVGGKWVSVERPDLRIEAMASNRTSPFDSQGS